MQLSQRLQLPKLKRKNDFVKGDEIIIYDPGRNLPNSSKQAKRMNSKWYKSMSIMRKPNIYNISGWYFIDKTICDSTPKYYVCLIRNDNLKLDLVIGINGIQKTGKKVTSFDFFKDEDFFV